MNGFVGEVILEACLVGLAVCGVSLFTACVLAPAWSEIRKFFSLPRIQQFLLIPCIVGLVYYGSTKQAWRITFDGGIKDGTPSSYVTNNTISITWQKDPRSEIPLPDEAAVYIDYRPNTATNEDWGLLAQSTVGAGHWSGTLEDATNFSYNVWAYYIPPEPVHTNGIWTYKTLKDRTDRFAIPLRARVECDGKAISTPDAKRKQEEEDHE